MDKMRVNGHSIVIKRNKLIIDGKVVVVKLKSSLFGNSISVKDGILQIGKNIIDIIPDGVVVNGEKQKLSGFSETLNENANVSETTKVVESAEVDAMDASSGNEAATKEAKSKHKNKHTVQIARHIINIDGGSVIDL